MLKKTITFEDLNGDSVTRDFFFHLNQTELVEMQVSEKGGMDQYLERITKEHDQKELFRIFKEIVLLSYGVKSSDGISFIKTEEERVKFMSMDAYNQLMIKLTTDADYAAAFLKGILPKLQLPDGNKPPKV